MNPDEEGRGMAYCEFCQRRRLYVNMLNEGGRLLCAPYVRHSCYGMTDKQAFKASFKNLERQNEPRHT